MTFRIVSVVVFATIVLGAVNFTAAQEQCSCPLKLESVCGSDGKTYPNKCLLDCHNTILKTKVTVLKNDSCENGGKCECESFPVQPVCGNDGLTYRNVCELRCARLEDQAIEVYNQGPCMRKLRRNKRQQPGYELRYRFNDVEWANINDCGLRYG